MKQQPHKQNNMVIVTTVIAYHWSSLYTGKQLITYITLDQLLFREQQLVDCNWTNCDKCLSMKLCVLAWVNCQNVVNKNYKEIFKTFKMYWCTLDKVCLKS